LGTGKSSGTNFIDQEDDVLLLDIGDDSGVGQGTYVTDSFSVEGLGKLHPATFIAVRGLQNSTRFSD
jgi:hypothetical protein